jgi:hypothetical protein
MRLGKHLRELTRLRRGVAASALVAVAAAVWSVAGVSILPPRLTPRSLEMATGYTQVVVDTPRSALLDLRQSTDDIDALKNRAVLVGTVMASPPVRAFIARRAGLPAGALQVVPPRTPAQPRATAASGHKKGATDLLRSTDQYRLDIRANPTVPILDVYAQAPTASAAAGLANAAVTGLEDYLRHLATADRTPAELQVRIRRLGGARGDVINNGIGLQVALVTFLIVFGVACCAAVVVARVRRGWLLAAESDRQPA